MSREVVIMSSTPQRQRYDHNAVIAEDEGGAADGAGTAGRAGAGACVRVSGFSQDKRHVENSIDETGRIGKRPTGSLQVNQVVVSTHTETPATPRPTPSGCVRVPNARV